MHNVHTQHEQTIYAHGMKRHFSLTSKCCHQYELIIIKLGSEQHSITITADFSYLNPYQKVLGAKQPNLALEFKFGKKTLHIRD